ncbi:hypothetical protein F4X33_05180 [Candidatus Poribacteria bacterium]|nr:hypothetical protein [Candidatus Poribacteria bacterium]
MPLVVQPPRRLSTLEECAVNLVFNGLINPKELMVEVPNVVRTGNDEVAGSSSAGKIKLSRTKHADAENLHIFTEVDDIDKTRPSNIKYLATLVHEAGHYWQHVHKRHNIRRPYYEFSDNVLRATNFICKEQQASVRQVYFILKWQWDLGIPRLDLTNSTNARDNVGPTNRYCRIAARGHIRNKRYMSRHEVSKFFPSRFQRYLADLHKWSII